MNGPRWLKTPLAGTATVLACLAMLAIPLWHLTSAAPAPGLSAGKPVAHPDTTPAVLRARLLAPAYQLRVTSGNNQVLFDVKDIPAGESEYDVAVAIEDGGLDLTIEARFDASAGETAVFLTTMPDGLDDQTHYAIGRGGIRETLRYEWRTATTTPR